MGIFDNFNPLNPAERPLFVEFNGIRADEQRDKTVTTSNRLVDNVISQLESEISNHHKRAADLAKESDALGHVIGLDPAAEAAKKTYEALQSPINVYQPPMGSQDQIEAARTLVEKTHTLSADQQLQPINGIADDSQFTIAA